MAHLQIRVSNVNPNDTHGGGGCICDPVKQTDCKPPYVIFTDTYLEDPRSPITVACQTCLAKAFEASRGEALEIGERGPATAQYSKELKTPPVTKATIELIEDDEPEV